MRMCIAAEVHCLLKHLQTSRSRLRKAYRINVSLKSYCKNGFSDHRTKPIPRKAP